MSTPKAKRPILHGTMTTQDIKSKRFVFRLLGSVYDELKGEQEAHPTVLTVNITAVSEQDAERKIGAAIEELATAVETLRLQRLREAEKRTIEQPKGYWKTRNVHLNRPESYSSSEIKIPTQQPQQGLPGDAHRDIPGDLAHEAIENFIKGTKE